MVVDILGLQEDDEEISDDNTEGSFGRVFEGSYRGRFGSTAFRVPR